MDHNAAWAFSKNFISGGPLIRHRVSFTPPPSFLKLLALRNYCQKFGSAGKKILIPGMCFTHFTIGSPPKKIHKFVL